MRFDKEKSQMAYDLWNGTDRMAIGEKMEIMVNDKQTFPRQDEVEIEFEIHDGFAVGNHHGREYLMLYPTVEDVEQNEKWMERVEDYIGLAPVADTGLQPQDIALTFGKIVSSRQLPLNLEDYDSVIRLDANVTLDKALDILNNEVRKDIKNFYHLDIPEVKDIPEKENGKIEKGYLILRTDKPAEFIAQPKTPAEIAALENEAIENGTFGSLAQIIDSVESRKMHGRVTDVQFTKGENNLYSVTCKIDGVQMPAKQLTNRESLRVHQNITRDMDPTLTFTYPMLLQRFAKEVKQHTQSLQQEAAEQDERPANLQDFRDFMRSRFPDGLTLQLSSMDFYRMMDLSNLMTELSELRAGSMHENLNMPFWYGRIADGSIHPGDTERPVLHTTVHIRPEQYGFLLPQIVMRRDELPQDLLNEAADNQLKKFDGEYSHMQFQIPQCLDFRDAMQIENMPYRQALQVRNHHGCANNKELAECIALTKLAGGEGMKAVKPTVLNQDVIDTMNRYLVDKGEPGEQVYDVATRLEGHMQLLERGYFPHVRYNIAFSCKATDRTAEENAVRMTEALNRNFPYVSAMCEVDKVNVSVNSPHPKNHATVERFIMTQHLLGTDYRREPFNDLSGINRLTYMMSNGQTIDAYVKRPGTGMKHQYLLEKIDGFLYMRKIKEGESPSAHAVIATDDKLAADKVRIHDCYRMDNDYLRIRDSSLYRKQRAEGLAPEWMVRCKVDGIQESGRSVSMKFNHIINHVTDNGKKAPDNRTWDLLKHYVAMVEYNDVLRGMEQHQSQGLKR